MSIQLSDFMQLQYIPDIVFIERYCPARLDQPESDSNG
jgi:hypothetical protein